MDVFAIFEGIYDWAMSNPVIALLWAILGAILVFAGGILVIAGKTVIQTLAKHVTEKVLNRSSAKASEQIAGETFDEPSAPLLPNRTAEEFIELDTDDLIAIYGEKNPPYHVRIGETDWTFAAWREIEPSGNWTVGSQAISIHYQDKWFELDHQLDGITRNRLKALSNAPKTERLFNGDPYRIISIERQDDHHKINVGRCKYFDSLRTNFSMDFVLPSEGKSLRQILHEDVGTVGSLKASRLPNHMGLVIIVETKDGLIVSQKRSAKVQIRPNSLSASVSGTFEKNDLSAGGGSIPLERAVEGVFREMHGELGGDYRVAAENCYFLGLIREFRRGGFPDFYFYYQSPYTFDEIEENSKDAEESFEFDGIRGDYVGSQLLLADYDQAKGAFDQRINKLLKSIAGQANITLSLGIALYYELMVRRAKHAKQL